MTNDDGTGLLDARGRPLRDLRISLTDRCNFRCVYCMPRETLGPDHAFLPSDRLLSFDEIERITRASMRLGVRKVRLTGGEPLLRDDIETLIASLKTLDGLEVAMTPNGALLGDRAVALARAGLDRVTVSLDSTDPETFRRMSDTRVPVARVLSGIDSAVAAGLGPGSGTDLRALIRSGADDDTIDSTFRRLWAVRSDRYSELRSHAADEPRVGPRVEMSYIGG